jgi:site-specific DNA recombinase
MRAAIYCRVSTKEQAQNLSLPTQLKSCREYCARHGFDVAAVFEDAGESAKTTDRPGFQELLRFCRENKGRVQFVIVLNVTRFARNAHDHAVVRALLHRLGVSLRAVNEPISDDPVGRLTENMLAAIAQFDNDQKAERTKAGMLTALGRGHWTWRAPLGYLNGNKKVGEPSLRPDPERAPLIKSAFELAASGQHTPTELLRMVTALGLVTRKGRPLSNQTFATILRNPLYAGFLNAPGFGVKGARGDFQALVPEILFRQVQAVLAKGAGAVQHHLDNPEFPLRRFVTCDRCETPLTGSASRGRANRYSYYHCRKCKGVSVRKEFLEKDFIDLLESLQPRAEFMKLFRAVVLDLWKERCAAAGSLRADLERRLLDLQHREEVLDEAFLFKKQIDSQTYERQRDKLREDVALARIELEGARLDEIDVEGILGFAEHVLGNAAALWMNASPELRQRLQRVFFPEGLRFTDGKIGTAVTCFAFKQMAAIRNGNSSLASPSTPSWNQILQWLREMAELRESGVVAA